MTYPNPDDTDPTTRDTVDLSEAPVGVHGDDGRHELSNTERAQESVRRTLHEEEPVRTRDEDERLRDDSDLEVDHGVQDVVVDVGGLVCAALECNTELVVEPRRADSDGDQSDAEERVEFIEAN